MNKTKIINLAVAGIVLFGCSTADKTTVAEPVVTHNVARTSEGALAQIETQLIEAEVLVKEIDKASRTMKIENAEKVVSTIKAGPEVKRFDEIKAGDKIKVAMAQAVAFEVRPVSKEELANPNAIGVGAARNTYELPPGMALSSVVRTIVKINKIDLQAQTVTVELPDASKQTIKVRYPENLTRVKVGDTVVVAFIEAIALEIEKL